MNDHDGTEIIFNLATRPVLFKILRIEFNNEPKNEDGIKYCTEQIAAIEKEMDNIIVNRNLLGDFMKRAVKKEVKDNLPPGIIIGSGRLFDE